MIRFGLKLVLASGREALTRLLVITGAVAIGVALLLSVLAEFHAFQTESNRPCWECTGTAPLSSPLPDHGLAANYSVDFYQGQTLERLDVAALGPGAPVPPGISRLPGPGEYYASPALAHLLSMVPADQLGDRFPGRLAGTIGDAALTGPGELVVFAGYTPRALANIPGTGWVTAIGTAPGREVFTPFFRYAFATGVLAVLFPVLILISTGTRLAAARREERFASLRLVGATSGDISVVASVDAVVTALLGAVVGTALFAAVRPALARAELTGTRYFASTVNATLWEYLALIVAVPLASAIASLLSLRRVRISPLGVTRRATPPRPSAWRLLPLGAGIGLFIAGALATSSKSIGTAMYPGLLVTMIGLVIAGPWLTAMLSRLCGRVLNGASPLLATRRLADDPKVAFRAMRGLVLAVFLGTIVGALVPTLDTLVATPNAGSLSNVLVDAAGVSPQAGAALVSGLQDIPGTAVYPFYSLSQAGTAKAGGTNQPPYNAVVSCAVIKELAVLGRCAPGLTSVQVNDQNLTSDNPHFSTQAFVSRANPAYTGSLAALGLDTVLVRVNNAATLERARTYLAVHAPPQSTSGQGQAATPPRTFAETIAIRTQRAALAGKLFDYAVGLTVLVAGCSLAVSIGGGLVDRKRPFTLLRVSGTPLGTLWRVVLLEAVVPLAAALLVAAGIAYGMSATAVVRLAPAGTPIPGLTATYYATLGIGLAVALAVVAATLPLLGRITAPASIRFE
ncbi:MAG TPA: FtsX-like permease family protein [Streptosporangiaceae bacterium]|nr:FtsX-like permease family protein [Streptosporangiaceae bacterium]